MSQRADDSLDAVLFLQRVGARGAEDRAAQRQDASNASGRQLVDHALLETAGPAVLNTADPMAELEGAPGDRPDRRVQTWCVTANRKDSDSHGDRLERHGFASRCVDLLDEIGEREL